MEHSWVFVEPCVDLKETLDLRYSHRFLRLAPESYKDVGVLYAWKV